MKNKNKEPYFCSLHGYFNTEYCPFCRALNDEAQQKLGN